MNAGKMNSLLLFKRMLINISCNIHFAVFPLGYSSKYVILGFHLTELRAGHYHTQEIVT